ncbi:conserved hypothetical protein [Gammaproteobacteria bacterium]
MGAGLSSNHLHAVLSYGFSLPGVHQATALQTSQVNRGLFLGMLVGGLAGMAGAGLAIWFPPPSLVVGSWFLWAAGGVGAVVGGMLGGMLARDRLNPEILPYESAILRGAVLLMVDVSRHEVNETINLVRLHHPEAFLQVAVSPEVPKQESSS